MIGTMTKTIHMGEYYEWTDNGTWKKYYNAGPERIAYITNSSALTYIYADHLGSAVATSNASGGGISRLGYYPFGEDRYGNNNLSYQYTGQREEPSIKLYDYHARFYDPSLGRFVQADTIVPGPGNPMAYDRYAYVKNSPIVYKDPSGNWEFKDSPSDPYWSKEKIGFLTPKPTAKCIGDCYDAYLTYKFVVYGLERRPFMEEILYMTAETEYAILADYKYVKKFGQEALARNYYEACFSDTIDGCQGDQIYKFLSGYEPWTDRRGTKNNVKTPPERASYLIKALESHKSWLMSDIETILDSNIANRRTWTQGKIDNFPWQWFGPFSPSENCAKGVSPQYSISMGDGIFVWMLTANQDFSFQSYCP